MTDLSAQPIDGKVVQGMFEKGLGRWLDAPLREKLAAAGLDTATWQPSYLHDTWHQAVVATAQHLFPGQPEDAALRSLGLRLIEGLEREGVFKGAMMTMAKFAGPKRVLKQLQNLPLRGFAFLDPKVNDLDGKAVEITLLNVPSLSFMAGAIEGLLRVIGAKQGKVSPSVRAGRGLLSISWS